MSMRGVSVASEHSLNYESAISANDKYVALLTNLIIDDKYPERTKIIEDEIQKLIEENDNIADFSSEELSKYPSKLQLQYERFEQSLA